MTKTTTPPTATDTMIVVVVSTHSAVYVISVSSDIGNTDASNGSGDCKKKN